jgi:serine/threonine protein kinase
MSYNLYELLSNTNFLGISLTLLKKFAVQILKALAFLSHFGIIHCGTFSHWSSSSIHILPFSDPPIYLSTQKDLKPENIVLRHPRCSTIKLIDFGSACHINERMYTYIQSRFYRSPEVMLGCPYGHPIDMWGLGCILVEMHTGKPLFPGKDNTEMIHRITHLLEPVPTEMMKNASSTSRRKFQSIFKPVCRWSKTSTSREIVRTFLLATKRCSNEKSLPLLSPKCRKHIGSFFCTGYRLECSYNPLKENTLEAVVAPAAKRRSGDASHTPQKYEVFLSLIRSMLAVNPVERITPHDAFLYLKNNL